MAQSRHHTVARVDRLETAFIRMTDVLVSQNERIDRVHSELQVLRESVTGRLDAVTDRLDRLIAISTKERTLGIERLSAIEERVARLERHAGL
jgi:hypothetical protein